MRERSEKIVFTDQHFTMLRFDVVGDRAREGQLAIGALGVADGKRLNGTAANLCHERGHRARIQAAAEKYAQRHIAHQVALDCAFQKLTITANVITLIAHFVRI